MAFASPSEFCGPTAEIEGGKGAETEEEEEEEETISSIPSPPPPPSPPPRLSDAEAIGSANA